jgi:hypothetical protein
VCQYIAFVASTMAKNPIQKNMSDLGVPAEAYYDGAIDGQA